MRGRGRGGNGVEQRREGLAGFRVDVHALPDALGLATNEAEHGSTLSLFEINKEAHIAELAHQDGKDVCQGSDQLRG
eukprot:4754844-Amphidinium_carterae.1